MSHRWRDRVFGLTVLLLGSIFPNGWGETKLIAKKARISVEIQSALDESQVLCKLHGRVLYKGRPYAKAGLDITLSSSRGHELRHISTQSDGTYFLAVHMNVCDKDRLEWEIKAHTINLETAQQSGCRIMNGDSATVVLNTLLEFKSES